jgi:hypothetical protein
VVVGVDTAAERRLAALSLVRQGRMYDLGRVLDERAPVFPGRHYRQLLVPNAAPIGSLNWVADVVSTTTQVGTHIDALCHLSEDGRIHGVLIAENLDLSALAADGVREFCLILTHPKLRGATGAWTSPIALV